MSNVINLRKAPVVIEVDPARITSPGEIKAGDKVRTPDGRTWNAVLYSGTAGADGLPSDTAEVQLIPDLACGYPLYDPHAVESDLGLLYVVAEVRS